MDSVVWRDTVERLECNRQDSRYVSEEFASELFNEATRSNRPIWNRQEWQGPHPLVERRYLGKHLLSDREFTQVLDNRGIVPGRRGLRRLTMEWSHGC